MKLKEVLERHPRTVAIVRFKGAQEVGQTVYGGGLPPQNPAVNLQVALIADKVSGSGKFIRLGETQGDEIMGWIHVEALEVLEILGVLSVIGDVVIPLTVDDPLEMKDAVERLAS